MKQYYLNKFICSILFLIILNPCCGQVFMFHGSIKDKAGNLWFATTGAGVYRYDAIARKFTNLTRKDGLLSDNVSSVYQDKAGHIWFSTQKGVCRYDGKTFYNFTSASACPVEMDLLLEDRKGNLWFGTTGYGICHYNPITGAFTNFTKENGGLSSNAIQCMLEDKSGNIWVGERAGGVCRYDTASGRFIKVNKGACFSNQMMDIKEDKAGNIWFVNLYTGICRYNPASDKFTHFTEENGFCNDTVTCMYEDKTGNLWFGGKGLCRFDGKYFTRFTEKDGLTKSEVWTILEDNDGAIWAGTKGGLYRFHSPSGKFVDYIYKVNSNSN